MTKIIEGILGLSGNPTHQGHIATVRLAQAELGLDRMRLMINPHNPLKDPAVYAPFADRLQIARYEVAGSRYADGSVTVCDFEQRLRERGVLNETIAMLDTFQNEFTDTQPVWMMGADVLKEIHTWGGEWNRIFEEYPVVVFARPGDHDALNSVAGRAFSHLAVQPDSFISEPGQWTWIETANHPASSTAIRADIVAGRQPQHLSEQSYQHILQRGLYGATQ